MTAHFLAHRVVVRGAGEMASGVIRRLSMAGFEVIALEQTAPDCVRRTVCYAEAVYQEKVTIEGVTAILVDSVERADRLAAPTFVPMLVDPQAESLSALHPLVLVDGRMLKNRIDTRLDMAPIVVGLGPGFVVGQNCHAAVETHRGFDLGRVLYGGSPQADTGVPSPVNGIGADRVLRSPADGTFRTRCAIRDTVAAGQVIGEVNGRPVVGRVGGIVRGLIRDESLVTAGQKLGDIDPRGIREFCDRISHKANAIAGGVLEAVLALRLTLTQTSG